MAEPLWQVGNLLRDPAAGQAKGAHERRVISRLLLFQFLLLVRFASLAVLLVIPYSNSAHSDARSAASSGLASVDLRLDHTVVERSPCFNLPNQARHSRQQQVLKIWPDPIQSCAYIFREAKQSISETIGIIQ